MTKKELSDILHALNIPVNEGITSEKNMNAYRRIVFWPYIEQDETASGAEYYNRVTYQVSLFARTPQCEKYRELRKRLREVEVRPVYYHEYVENDPVFAKTWHTYCAVEVTEEATDE